MIVLVVWLLGCAAFVYPLHQRLLAMDDYGDPDEMDRALTGMIAVFITAVWPPVLVGWLVLRCSRRVWTGHWSERDPERKP